MGMNGENIKHGIKRHGLWASVLTGAALLGLFYLYRLLKSNLDADFMQKLPRTFRPHTPAQD